MLAAIRRWLDQRRHGSGRDVTVMVHVFDEVDGKPLMGPPIGQLELRMEFPPELGDVLSLPQLDINVAVMRRQLVLANGEWTTVCYARDLEGDAMMRRMGMPARIEE